MSDTAVFQKELQCPSCAGQCVYDPAQQALSCLSCGSAYSLERDDDADAAAEFPFDPGAPTPDAPVTIQAQVHRCETCGGTVTFSGPALSLRCAYCDGPVVLDTHDSGYAAMALIPFQVTQADAQSHALTWVRRRIGAPADLHDIVAEGRVAGIYVPFWTFDSHEAVNYWARYKVRSGKRTVTRTARGALRMRFDDLLVPASHHVTPLIRDGILHDFFPERLRPYRAGYLAGFRAEQHHQSVAQGLDANKSDKALLIRNRIRSHVGKSGVHDIRYDTDTTGIHYRRILLPVWILHYKYNGVAMKVVVCGMQGRTYGERPFSIWKLAGYAALISGIAVGTGVMWGAAGLL
jgi:ribosomal protein S27E